MYPLSGFDRALTTFGRLTVQLTTVRFLTGPCQCSGGGVLRWEGGGGSGWRRIRVVAHRVAQDLRFDRWEHRSVVEARYGRGQRTTDAGRVYRGSAYGIAARGRRCRSIDATPGRRVAERLLAGVARSGKDAGIRRPLHRGAGPRDERFVPGACAAGRRARGCRDCAARRATRAERSRIHAVPRDEPLVPRPGVAAHASPRGPAPRSRPICYPTREPRNCLFRLVKPTFGRSP
jgi:hypothetical protein